MNHIYRVLWNRALGRFCVASELGRSRCRATTTRASVRPLVDSAPGLLVFAACVALAWSAPAWSQRVLPQEPRVVTGDVTIAQNGPQMTVRQDHVTAIIEWQSFDIGAQHQVKFEQPGASSVALNRVVGADASAIHGTLQANGRVFLVNPNGVLFGQGANVNVGGLVASTLGISDNDFLAGNYRFQGGGRHRQGGAVINQGRISAADGGAVALLGGSVNNQGTIAARLGSVALAAGNQVKLDFAGDGLLHVQVQESAVNALVENHQLIQADGGSVLMTAKATDALLQTVVNNTGTVQARTVENRTGKIVLLGGFDGGTTRVAGTLDASAPEGGDGGFVDTSGAHVQIGAGTRVTTRAARGRTGTWLIDPTDFTIGTGAGLKTGSGIGAETLMDNLAENNVKLQTMEDGSEAGDIHVNAPVAWSQNKLTLNAHGNINVNALMSVSGDGTLDMNYGDTRGNADVSPAPGSNLLVNGSGRVDFEHAGSGLLRINGHDFEVVNHLDKLQEIAEKLDGRFALGQSIDASGWEDFRPIGNAESRFTGIFDGLGHTIDGLTIKLQDSSYVGLFGRADGATLRNVGLVDVSIVGGPWTGGLAGSLAEGTIINAYVTGNVTGLDRVGGVAGNLSRSNIINVHATGSVSGNFFIGGLAGFSDDSSHITDAYAAASVDGQQYIGGLVGNQAGESIINNSYATGSVAGQDYVGGLVGAQARSTIRSAYATGSVTGRDMVGGLLGQQGQYGSIIDTYATGSVQGTGLTGGLVSSRLVGSSVTNSYWNHETTGQATSDGGGTGLSTQEMKQLASFTGWDIKAEGGSGAVWRIYEGQTAPLLRSFLTAVSIGGDAKSDYNGTTVHAVDNYARPATGDTTQLLGTLQYEVRHKNVGTYRGENLRGLGGLYSTQQGYDISYDTANSSLSVAPRQINGTIGAADKTYDATTVAMTSGQLEGLLAGDKVELGTSGSFADRSAGSGKTVNVNGTLSGDDARNYRLVHNATARADIERLAINASIWADDKTYDGSNDASTHGTLAGVLGSDRVQLQTSGSFSDAQPGSGKAVLLGAVLEGADAGNYRLLHNALTHASIHAAATTPPAAGSPLWLSALYPGAHPSRIDRPGADAAAHDSGCFSDVQAMLPSLFNLPGSAAAAPAPDSRPAALFAAVGGPANDRACARAPF